MHKATSLFINRRKSVVKERKAQTIEEFYKLGKELGSGGFATVVLGKDKKDGSTWALKKMNMPKYRANEAATKKEVELLAGLSHPGVVRLREVVITEQHFVIVMELLSGGELFDRIVDRERYSEEDAKIVAKSLLETLAYLHEHAIVHRDLKPENLVFDATGDDANLKLTDFGFATAFDPRNKLTATCGTPEYVAPEVLNEQPYDTKVDVWSAGVVIYILLCGFPPFYGDNDDELFERICTRRFKFIKPYWDVISDDAKDLVGKMFTLDPKQRPSAREALGHKWFASVQTDQPDLSAALEEMRRYNATRKLKKGVLTVMAMNKLKNMIGGVSK